MSWNITFEIRDGKIRREPGDPDGGVEIVGTPPNGVIQVNGHSDDAGTNIGLFARNISVSARMPTLSTPPQPAAADS